MKFGKLLCAVVIAAGLLIATVTSSSATVYTTTRSSTQNIDWNNSGHWSPIGVPGAGDTINLSNPATEGENSVNQGDDGGTTLNAVGHVTLDGNSPGETGYRFRRGCLDFDNNGADSILTLNGATDTTLQFRYNQTGQRILLRNNLLVVANNTEGRVDFRGNFTSDNISRTITKRGLGELRFRDTGDTSGYRGNIIVEEGVLRFRNAGLHGLQGGNTITIQSGAQLRLDGADVLGANFTYVFGGAELYISGFGRDEAMGGSGGAIRQHLGISGDIATISNKIVLAGDASIHVNMEDGVGSTLTLAGKVNGSGVLYKAGGGTLNLSGANSTAGMIIESGVVTLLSTGAMANAPLRFTSRSSIRVLNLFGNHTVSLLDGDAPDPGEEGVSNTLTIHTAGAGTSFTVAQDMFFDDGNEESTRFQGDIAGPGNVIKDGDGILRFTRWPKTYSGATIIREGVLEMAASATPANSSSVTVEHGGQLRFSSSGTDVAYLFGGNVMLNGSGRGNDGIVRPGLSGALRYDPGNDGNTATLANSVVLQSDAHIHVTGSDNTLSLPGALSGSGALIKNGSGRLSVSIANGFSGNVRLDAGTLKLGNMLIPETATLSVSNGAILSLDFQGTNTLTGITFDGVAQNTGTWGTMGSGAENEAAWITGSGFLWVPSSGPVQFQISAQLDFIPKGLDSEHQVSVSFDRNDNATYTLQYSTNLVDGSWVDLVSDTTSPLVHDHTSSDSTGFYRVKRE